MNKTILVTGGTGYIGSWVVKGLLEHGHTVRLAVRDKSNTSKYDFLQKIATKESGILELWEADLLKEGSFDEAAQGSDMIAHIASPFILGVKDVQKNLVDPAVKGTANVLEAANRSNTVNKVVLTSSVAAIHGDNIDMKNKNLNVFTEEHFNTSSSLNHQPYSYSKVQAELKAWEIANEQEQWELVVMNPSFVMGPSLTTSSQSESLKIMKDMLSGKYRTGAPELYFGYVDVRDVAKAHILGLETNTNGRHILAERVTDMLSFANIINAHYPGVYKLPKSFAPKWLLSIIGGLFGVTRKFVKNNVGHTLKLDNSKSLDQLKIEYIPLEQTVKDMIEQMKLLKVI